MSSVLLKQKPNIEIIVSFGLRRYVHFMNIWTELILNGCNHLDGVWSLFHRRWGHCLNQVETRTVSRSKIPSCHLHRYQLYSPSKYIHCWIMFSIQEKFFSIPFLIHIQNLTRKQMVRSPENADVRRFVPHLCWAHEICNIYVSRGMVIFHKYFFRSRSFLNLNSIWEQTISFNSFN